MTLNRVNAQKEACICKLATYSHFHWGHLSDAFALFSKATYSNSYIHTYIHWWRPLSHSCPIQICKLTNLVIVTDQLWRMPLFTSCAATSVSFSPVSKCTLLCGDTVWVSRKKNMYVIFFILPCLINGNWTNYYTTFYCTFVFDVYNTL